MVTSMMTVHNDSIISDPFLRKRNVARSLSHPRLFEYINDRMRVAYKYFAIPQTKAGPVVSDFDPQLLQKRLQENMKRLPDSGENEQLQAQGQKRNLSRQEREALQARPDLPLGPQAHPKGAEKQKDRAEKSKMSDGIGADTAFAHSYSVIQSVKTILNSDKEAAEKNATDFDQNQSTLETAVNNLHANVWFGAMSALRELTAASQQPSEHIKEQEQVKTAEKGCSSLEDFVTELLDSVIMDSVALYKVRMSCAGIVRQSPTPKTDILEDGQKSADICDTEEAVGTGGVSTESEKESDEGDTLSQEVDCPAASNAVVSLKAEDFVFNFDEETLTDRQVCMYECVCACVGTHATFTSQSYLFLSDCLRLCASEPQLLTRLRVRYSFLNLIIT